MTAEPVPVGSRAVLIGVSAYEYAEFPPIRAARNSLQAMRSLLSDPALCAWPPEWITVIANPISATELAAAVADQAERTTGVLLVYYVGHGVLSPGGELCLTVTSTRPDRPKITGLPWDTVADVLRGCPAATRVAILDCCVAGQAVEALTPDSDDGFADIAHVDGVYTLTATTGNRAAHVAPPGQQDTACTSFTGELRDLVQQGIPGKARRLTLSDVYPVLRQRLRGKGLPAPNQRGIDAASRFLFTVNAAEAGPRAPDPAGGPPGPLTPPPPPEPAGPPGSPQAGVVTDALRAAHSITDDAAKAPALAAVAGAVALTDPGRAQRLIADAQRIAESVPSPAARAAALVAVADNLAAIDAPGAVRLAQAIPEPGSKAPALAAAAAGLAATDRGHANTLIAEAEDLAQAIPGATPKASALAAVAARLAPADADRAERLAHSVPNPSLRAPALAAIAEALTATDTDRAARLIADAERLALSIPGASLRAPALATVARALSATDPRRATALIADAEHLAQAIPGTAQKSSALAAVAAGLAPTDTERAQRLAQSIVGAASRALALAAVAKSAATSAGRASE
jgi:caspase domain-containing protein